MMGTTFLFDKTKSPKMSQLESLLGPKKRYWLEIRKFMKDNYRVDGEFKLMGKSWAYWFRKASRTLLTIYPKENIFTAQIVLGKKEIEEAKKAVFHANVKNIYKKAKQYHDGKWLFIDVVKKEDVSDIYKLLLIKRNPDKK